MIIFFRWKFKFQRPTQSLKFDANFQPPQKLLFRMHSHLNLEFLSENSCQSNKRFLLLVIQQTYQLINYTGIHYHIVLWLYLFTNHYKTVDRLKFQIQASYCFHWMDFRVESAVYEGIIRKKNCILDIVIKIENKGSQIVENIANDLLTR